MGNINEKSLVPAFYMEQPGEVCSIACNRVYMLT